MKHQVATRSISRRQRYVISVGLAVLFLLTALLNFPAPWNAAASSLRKVGVPVSDYWNVPFRLGLDLQGGAHLVYEADLKDIPSAERGDAVAGARDVIERRVNAFGVSEPLVETSRSGDVYRLNVELAGITDVNKAIKEIGETPILEFKVPKTTATEAEKQDLEKQNAEILKKANELLARVKRGEDFAALAKDNSIDASKDAEGKTDFVSRYNPTYSELVKKIEELKLRKGMLAAKVLETSQDYWIAKVLDVRNTEREYEASHILICYKGAKYCDQERTKEEALAEAKKIIAEARKDNFDMLAKANSDESGSDKSGGYLGKFPASMMVKEFKEFADALKTMRVGEISKVPVETEFGYHIVYKKGDLPLPEYQLQIIELSKASQQANEAAQWENTNLSGKDLKTARVDFDQNTGMPRVAIVFTEEGSKKFAELTKKWVGQQIAIFLDGTVISAPTVQEEITTGEATISGGNMGLEEAKTLARRLNAGALPVPITLVSQSSVGPTLGQVALDMSLKAGLISFALIALFMIAYYRLPGLIAVGALTLYVSIVLSIFKLLPVTLTLSGIAGFIITIGMAVDANVLIFERLREEIAQGRSLKAAVEEGFRRAWSSIFDSNLTTLFSAFLLFFFTSSVIKGFALTLAIGVAVSMFSAIYVTRVMLSDIAVTRIAQYTGLFAPAKKKVAEVKK